MSGAEMKYVDLAFSKNHVFPLGPNVLGFEKDIADFTGAGYVTCLSSGTAAIHLALIMLGVEAGDEVICPSFTFSATVNPIAYLKATPVLIDSEPGTWNMDPQLLRTALDERVKNNGTKPKAIIVVHLYGMPARMGQIMSIANAYDIPVIEDAAEALGSTYRQKHCGTIGQIGIYSFNGNKIITTSGGGALVSDQAAFCERALYLSTQARDPAPHYQHSEIGYNYRMSNISAGIGRGQMEVLHERIHKRREHFFYYESKLKHLDQLNFHREPAEAFFSNHWLSTALIDPAGGSSPEELRQFLEKRNIESRPLWKPMHLQPVFAECPTYLNGVSEDLFSRGICLPSSSNLSRQQRQLVVEAIDDFFR